MDINLDYQADMLCRKIKHYLITLFGKTLEESSDEEFYRAFCYTLREEIMINWTASAHSIKRKKPKILYYLCMEYMPGRLLGNNIINIHAMPIVKKVLLNFQKHLDQLLHRENDPGLGNGGLGRLAACYIDSLATLDYPAVAYGLRYQYGIFDQEIWNGKQVERPDMWLFHENPWEFRRDGHAVGVYYCGKAVSKQNESGEEVYDLVDYDEVRALSYDIPIIGYKENSDFNVNTLRLWTTKESPRNFQLQRFNAGQLDQAAENTSLTDVLYPNDNNETGKRIRLKQEFLLVSASLHDILTHFDRNFSDVSLIPDKISIHINDTHPALIIPELMHQLMHKYNLSWNKSWEYVQACCNFTNHTILKESLEEWNQHRIEMLLPRQYKIIERLNYELCGKVRSHFHGDEDKVRNMSIIEGGQVRMANLAIYGSKRVNGVAQLHTDILKNTVFKDFNEMFPNKFLNVTNGVTPRRWLLCSNPKLADFISKRIGREWITNFEKIADLKKFADDETSLTEFIEIKKENKRRLIQFIKEENPLRDDAGNPIGHFYPLGEDALFDVQVKRIHEYKRQLMNALHALMLYNDIKQNPSSRKIKRLILIAGKAAPGYALAKDIVRFIHCLSRKINSDPLVSQQLQLIFIENYNVSRAEMIIPAADLSEQISTAGMEASGTGNMKLAINGALTIGTEDGANVEMHAAVPDPYWPFAFGASSKENELHIAKGDYSSIDIYKKNPKIREAVDALNDHSLAINNEEHVCLSNLYYYLLENRNNQLADKYFVLKDLESYYETQKKVEDLYIEPLKWAKYAIRNIASMGPFSSDGSIEKYAKEVWVLSKCYIDESELTRVREEYSEHDKCRIL